MKHIASKMIRALCGITAMLVLATGIAFIPANELDNGIYLAAATPHYQHPVTGMIEDSGGEKSKVLGQSMTESALHNEALVEVDPAGNTYITVRLNLMDNIEHPAFSVDTARNGSFTDVSSSLSLRNSLISSVQTTLPPAISADCSRSPAAVSAR